MLVHNYITFRPFGQRKENMLDALRELQELDQWVCYQLPNKIPMNPKTHGKAQPNNAVTWGSYEQATREVSMNGFDGTGFVFSKEDPYVGIDFDDCVKDGKINSQVTKWIRLLDSYTEISPSGTGIHILVRGTLPKQKKSSTTAIAPEPFIDCAEAYDRGRYFTITGKQVPGTPTTMNDRQEQLEAFCQEIRAHREQVQRKSNKLAKRIDEIGIAPSGKRNATCAKIAWHAGRMVAENGFIQEAVHEALYDAYRQWEVDDETPDKTRDTLDRCFQNGMNGNGSEENPEDEGETIATPISNENTIILGQQLSAELGAIEAKLYATNDPPTIFLRSGELTGVYTNEQYQPSLRVLDEHMLLSRIVHIADYFKPNGNPAHPTVQHAKLISVRDGLHFPPLIGLTEIPLARQDGTIITAPGYDAMSQMMYRPPRGLHIPAIPERPTQEQGREAALDAFRYIAEFPYVTDADRANAYGLMASLVLRNLFPLMRMALITAPKRGTGKSLMFKVMHIILTGRTGMTTVMPSSEEEMEKRLTTWVRDGSAPIFCLDNIEETIDYPCLSAFLTAERWKGRILGHSKMPEYSNLTIPMATGNNITIGGDMPRRTFKIAMDARISHPEERDEFTLKPLLTHVKNDRGRIIADLLTAYRAWYVAGQPDAQAKVHYQDDFSTWARIISGVLGFVGIDGFLQNLPELYAGSDVDGNAWENFLSYWFANYPGFQKTRELMEHLEKDITFADLLPGKLLSTFTDDRKRSAFSLVLGKAIMKKVGTPFGSDNLHIESVFDTDEKINKFRVVSRTK